MEAAEVRRGIAAATSVVVTVGGEVDDSIVLSDSNRLVVRLLPCDVVARVTPLTHFASAEQEVEIVRRLASTDIPVAPLDPRFEPRVFERDGFKITMWTSFAPMTDHLLRPADYAHALADLHRGLRPIDLAVPHVKDRIAASERDAANHDLTPELADAERATLVDALHDLAQVVVDRGAPEQLLHGEPHPWNLLSTADGLRFIDFENTARGPVEYDLGWVPRAVAEHHSSADLDLVDACRGIVLAIVATHRWRHDDDHPSGRPSGRPFLHALRDGPPWPALDDITW